MTFGSFIDPDFSVMDAPDLAERLGCPIGGGYRAMDHAHRLLGKSRINQFRYLHPLQSIDDILPSVPDLAA